MDGKTLRDNCASENFAKCILGSLIRNIQLDDF